MSRIGRINMSTNKDLLDGTVVVTTQLCCEITFADFQYFIRVSF